MSTDSGYYGVIDIGSNSVRLVVYSGLERVPASVFNEKTLCGLGADVGSTGKMGEGAVEDALQTLKRYKLLCEQMGVETVDAVATAAVRDAENGGEFVDRVAHDTGFRIRVIPGAEEGRLAALGAISGDPEARGIVGDLGGGSLELARVKAGRVTRMKSLPIGPLRLKSRFGDDFEAMKDFVKEILAEIDWLKKAEGEALYLVGGSWRNLAKLMMREQFSALPVLHGLRVRRSEMQGYAKRISHLRPEDIPFGQDLPARRLEILPVAALTLREVLKATSVNEAVVSTYGLREGLLFSQLGKSDRRLDPFLYQCVDLARERSRFPEHAELLYGWTRALFKSGAFEPAEMHRLHMAACLLCDIAWRGHPDFRAERAVEIVLHGQFVGIGHKGRAFLALALNQNYGASVDRSQIGRILPLLSAAAMMEARILGAGLRLAQRLSGGVSDGLVLSALSLTAHELRLSVAEDKMDLVNEVVIKRLRFLGQLLGRETAVQAVPPTDQHLLTPDKSDAA